MQQLHYKIFGDSGAPVVILHGLFGSLENWSSQAKKLAANFQVTSVDLRNHGRSPHADHMGYPAMADDIARLLDDLEIDRPNVIGHSMGGKAAMQLALNAPDRVDKLIVVDIAPRQYPRHHDDIFAALSRIELTTLSSRSQADEQLKSDIPEIAVRTFLLKNLQRVDDGFAWKMNLSVLCSDYEHIAAAVTANNAFEGQTLFIKGGNSDYLQREDQALITKLFPNAHAKAIQNAGHWPHVEKADVFHKVVIDFLSN